ncbi:MAG TPA: hypothetical protein VKT51_09405 [Candidatus Eremiobacteraceae bacterium]|nr:hypothetical protein [Candidatus Eremiobacteraceae bacterium]
MTTLIAAAALSALLHARPKRKRHPAAPRSTPIATERVIRRRVVRLAVIAALTRREAALEDFLALTETETPLVRLDTAMNLSDIEVGPSSIILDFLGSPIVHARVRNQSHQPFTGLLIAHVEDAAGRNVDLAYAVDSIAPGESRSIEMLCPAQFQPAALRWTLQPW